MKRLLHISIMLAACLALAAPALARENSTAGNPAVQDPEGKKREYYTDLKLISHEGRELRFYSDLLKDKVVLIHFFYTNCKTVATLQSKVVSDLQQLLGDHLGRDVFLLSITVDPARDTVEKVKDYARTFAARKGWTILTGKKENVDWVNYKLGSYRQNPEQHPAFFLLGNLKTGHWLKDIPETGSKKLAEHLLSLVDEGKATP